MQIKTVLVAIVLAAAPGLAAAEGCTSGKERSAASCAEGSIWDSSAGKCIASSTS